MVDFLTLILSYFYSNYHAWFVISLVLLSFALYSSKLPMDLISISIIATLLLFFSVFPYYDSDNNILKPTFAFLGFANSSLITIVSLLIIGKAITKSNALVSVSHYIFQMTGNRPKVTLLILLIVVTLLSSLMNNTPVVIIFLPIFYELSRKLKISASKIMMPLSFAAILGGMLSLLGSSTNLLVAGIVLDYGLEPIGIFDFIQPAMIIISISFIYIYFIMPKILPNNSNKVVDFMSTRQFISQIFISKNSSYTNSRLNEGFLAGGNQIMVRVIKRSQDYIKAPFQDGFQIQANDIITISGLKQDIISLISNNPDLFLTKPPSKTDVFYYKPQYFIPNIGDSSIAETVITPGSALINQKINEVNLSITHNSHIVSIQRKGREILNNMRDIALQAGDTLLLVGMDNKIDDVINDKNIVLTKRFQNTIISSKNLTKVLFTFLTMIIFSSFNILPLYITSFVAAFTLIVLRCINIGQALESIDHKILFMIASSLALGQALQATGGASIIADFLISTMRGNSEIFILISLFLLIATLTNILSNNATAVLFTPIIINLAEVMDIDYKLLIYGIIFASNCSFITPIGYQTNLLVMGPGKYTFSDYIKSGLPLAIIVCVIYGVYLKFVI